jgi:hypothetical protein
VKPTNRYVHLSLDRSRALEASNRQFNRAGEMHSYVSCMEHLSQQIPAMETNMQGRFTVIIISLMAALTAQAAAASEHQYTRSKNRTAISEQLRNSSAYAAPANGIVQSEMSDYAEGAMTSGIAGH